MPGALAREAGTVGVESHLLADIAGHCALCDQRLGEAGEQRFDRLAAAREQAVRVDRLRRALARRSAIGQCVALEQQHVVEAFGEHARGKQAGHAGADDEGAPGSRLICGSVHDDAPVLRGIG